MMEGPFDTMPRTVAEDLNIPTKGYRREFTVNLFPDEYIRFWCYCKHQRCQMATMARQILLAFLTQMEGRNGGPFPMPADGSKPGKGKRKEENDG